MTDWDCEPDSNAAESTNEIAASVNNGRHTAAFVKTNIIETFRFF